jgi:hypothetical protein
MESKINDIFLQLVKDIAYWGDLEESEICERVKRNPGYISQIKSRIKSGGSVAESFVNLLRLEFAEELKKKESGSAYIEDVPGVTLTYVVRLLSKVNVLFANEAQKTATMTEQDAGQVLDRMNEAALDEANSLFEELRKKP